MQIDFLKKIIGFVMKHHGVVTRSKTRRWRMIFWTSKWFEMSPNIFVLCFLSFCAVSRVKERLWSICCWRSFDFAWNVSSFDWMWCRRSTQVLSHFHFRNMMQLIFVKQWYCSASSFTQTSWHETIGNFFRVYASIRHTQVIHPFTCMYDIQLTKKPENPKEH